MGNNCAKTGGELIEYGGHSFEKYIDRAEI